MTEQTGSSTGGGGGRKPRWRRIVAALALSPRTDALIGEARHLAALLSSEIEFVHVGEDATGIESAIERVWRRSLEARRNASDSASAPSASAPRLTVLTGRPHRAICDYAERVGADLILAGAIEREGLVQEILGSVARKIARKATCSVLFLTAPREKGRTYRRIVISAQYDEGSTSMMKFLSDFSRRVGCNFVHLVYEYNPVIRLVSRMEESRAIGEKEQSRARLTQEKAHLAEFAIPFDFGEAELIYEGLADAEGLAAVQYTRSKDGDLLVYPVQQRPLTFWDRFFNHPVEVVLENLPAALLLYRPPVGRGCDPQTPAWKGD